MARRVDYDQIASAYDRRYAQHDYSGIEGTLRSLCNVSNARILEVGCGTGHWLRRFEEWGQRAIGLDKSAEMLCRATRRVIRDAPRSFPLPPPASTESSACMPCITSDPPTTSSPRRGALYGPGARVMIVGLDPHVSTKWYVYEYFEETLGLDLVRYPPAAGLRGRLSDLGFAHCETSLAEQLTRRMDARRAIADGLLEKTATSQLAILSEREYSDGIARIEAAIAAAEARGEALDLVADLSIFATTGTAPG